MPTPSSLSMEKGQRSCPAGSPFLEKTFILIVSINNCWVRNAADHRQGEELTGQLARAQGGGRGWGGGILQMRVTTKNFGALLGQRDQQGNWELLDVPDALHPIPVQVLQLRHRPQRLQEAGAGAGRRVQGQRRVPGRGRAAAAQGTATLCAAGRWGAQGHRCIP